MNLDRKLLVLAAAALVVACNGTTSGGAAGNLLVTSDVASLNNDGSQAHITITVTNGQGQPATGSVTITATGGNLNNSGSSNATVTLDAAGHATVTYACDFTFDTTHCGAGQVTVTAVWSSVANGTHVTLVGPSAPVTDGGTPPPPTPDAGPPPIVGPAGPAAAVIETAASPAVLGLQGSGIQETGLMSFLVTDSAGRPVPSAAVNFTQRQPALVTLGRTVGVTDSSGTVSVDYTSGANVGISAIIATVPATGANGSHPIAVRGAKPSGSGFYFRCLKTNLPVYTTTPRYESVECTVRLSDRYGNRVGIATPVSFAAEAGAISASAVTQPFDFANPTDPAEGTVTVTFTSDMGNGFGPVETTPLPADATQFPKPRVLEPSAGRFNPRDQLVTLIAMVSGEEAFVDANLNGQYDNGELFVDQGDPFIDANDNNVYDPATEPRFCGGSSCATYHAPNGVWDSDRTLWAATWVAFTGVPNMMADPWTPSTCIDYTDNNLSNPSNTSTAVRFLDDWLNVGPIDTTYAAQMQGSPTGLTLTTLGGFAELDNVGSMDPSWEKVSAASPTLACTVANTVNGACILQTEFGDWDSGYRLGVQVADGNKTPAAAAPGHACGVKTPGTQVGSFSVDLSVTGPHVVTHASIGGTYGF